MTLNEYAKKILSDAGCNEYTYGGEYSKHIMDDLKEAFPNGMEYPYIDVANEILSMSRPEPVKKAKYHMVFDMLDNIDGIDCDSLEEAKDQLYNTYCDWMAETQRRWKSDAPTEEEKNYWNTMIDSFCCWIDKYNSMTDEYETCYEASREELENIGWKEFM